MGLRKRIIGAIVLVGLAVIFVPMILNHSVTDRLVMDQLHRRPAEPTVDFVDQQAIQMPMTPIASKAVDEQYASAWLIQLASFSSAASAAQLAKKLQAQQYPAFVQRVKIDDKILHRVMIGPFTEQQQAQQLISDLTQQIKLKGHVIAYQPITENK